MKNENGFTLYEIMVSAAISSVFLLVIHSLYKSQQKSYAAQGQICAIQQNLRGGVCCMERDIRMAGYDPRASGNFGITDVGLDRDGNGRIEFTLDDNLDDINDETDGNGNVDGHETLAYSLYDYPTADPDGVLDLGRRYGGRRQLVAKNIDALGFAYAFDKTGDGDNSLNKDVNGNIIWAIDTDNDGELDANLDTDNDGDIDFNDNQAGESLAHADNGGLSDVALSDIRAVRLWLLARGDRSDPDYVNGMTYVVSNQRITPNDGLQRRLLISTVRYRNLGILPNN